MKKNAEKASILVQQAISETGGDFALTSARRYLIAALNELNQAHDKRQKREDRFKKIEAQDQERKKLRQEEAQLRIKKLDQMMEIEKSKLQSGVNPFSSP